MRSIGKAELMAVLGSGGGLSWDRADASCCDGDQRDGEHDAKELSDKHVGFLS